MRVLLGLAALASVVNAQQTISLAYTGNPVQASAVSNGATSLATIFVYINNLSTTINNIANSQQLNTGQIQQTNGNWAVNIDSTVNTMIWTFAVNQYTSQMQFRFTGFTGAGGALAWICDPCVQGQPNLASGSTSTCNTQYGPVATPVSTGGASYDGYNCALFTRQFSYNNLQTGANSFGVLLFDRNYPGPNQVSYSFSITKASGVHGDPMIMGMQGQDFQVHGVPDEIFNLLTYPNFQVNARFVYLSHAECVDNYTTCFAHPGTYISEEGIRLGKDKVHVLSGSYKKGLQVSLNGQRITGKHNVKLGSVEVVNHRRVVVTTPAMTITVSNSDKFLNQESQLHDKKLLALGKERRVLADGEEFHPEVPLHGLQGQTWRNVEYPSGLEYEGSINDYQVIDGNLFGTDFVFNQFKH